MRRNLISNTFLLACFVILIVNQIVSLHEEDEKKPSYLNSFDITINNFLVNLEITEDPSLLHDIDKDLYSNQDLSAEEMKKVLIQDEIKTKGFDFKVWSALDEAPKKCYQDFSLLFDDFPDKLKTLILTEFKTYANESFCCDQENMIKQLSAFFEKNSSILSEFLTNESKKAKNGLGAFYIPQNLINEINPEKKIDDNFQQETTNFIREMIKETNNLNSSFSNCFMKLNSIMIQNISLMCVNKNKYDLFFEKGLMTQIDSQIMKIKGIKNFIFNLKDEKEIFNNEYFSNVYLDVYIDCNDYANNFNHYSDSVVNSAIDSINLLSGSSECNYFSRNFSFDTQKDRDDEFYKQQEKSINKNDYNLFLNRLGIQSGEQPNNPEFYLDFWHTCVKQFNSQLNYLSEKDLEDLYKTIPIALYKNPKGLSTYIGRFDIDFSIIKKTFDLTNFNYFYIKCENKICVAQCASCSNLDFTWDNTNVVKNDSTYLEISCCSYICVIYVRILDNFASSGRANPNNNSFVVGAEIFHIKNSNYLFDLSALELEKLKNAKKSFLDEDKVMNNFEENENKLINKIENLIENQKFYVKDARLSNALFSLIETNDIESNQMLYKLNSNKQVNEIQLNDFIYGNLMQSNSTFIFNCENAKCYYQCKICDNSNKNKIEFNLKPNLNPKLDTTTESFSNGNQNVNPNLSANNNENKSNKSTGDYRILQEKEDPTIIVKKGSSGGGRGGGGGRSGGSHSSSSSSSKGSSFGGKSSSSSSSKSSSIGSSSSSSSKGTTFNAGKSSSAAVSHSSSASNSNNLIGIKNSSSSSGSSFAKQSSAASAASSISSSKGSSFNINSSKNSNYVSNNKVSSDNKSSSSNWMQKPANININDQQKVQYISNTYYISNNNNYKHYYQSKPLVNSQSYYPKTYKTYYSSSYSSNSIVVINNHRPIYSSYTYRTYYYYPDYYYYPYYGYGYSHNYYYNPYGIHYYNPIYLSPSGHHNNYNYYYIRPEYEEYYKDSNIISANYYNNYDLAAEYDPTDWMPLFDSFFDALNYIKSLDYDKLKEMKVTVKCSGLFCVLVVYNFNDDLKFDKSKERVYVDVIMRNFAFIESDEANKPRGNVNVGSDYLKKSQKICLIENIFFTNEKNVYNNQLESVFEKCGIESPYTRFPIRNYCVSKFREGMKIINFDNLISKATGYSFILSKLLKINDNNSETKRPVCQNLKDLSEENEKIKCGAYLIDSFFKEKINVLNNSIIDFSEKNVIEFYEKYENPIYFERIKQDASNFFNDDEARNFYFYSKMFINQSFNKELAIDSNKNYNLNTQIEDELHSVQQGVTLIKNTKSPSISSKNESSSSYSNESFMLKIYGSSKAPKAFNFFVYINYLLFFFLLLN